MTQFLQEKPIVLVAIIAVALGIAGWSIWRSFGPGPSDARASQVGTIPPGGSMFGPGAGGAPRTAPPPGMVPAGATLPGAGSAPGK